MNIQTKNNKNKKTFASIMIPQITKKKITPKEAVPGELLVDENGWIGFQKNPHLHSPLIYSGHSSETTFGTSKVKDLFQNFIETDITYVFQGVKLNPSLENKINYSKNNNNEYVNKLGAYNMLRNASIKLFKMQLLIDDFTYLKTGMLSYV